VSMMYLPTRPEELARPLAKDYFGVKQDADGFACAGGEDDGLPVTRFS
jgi:hypothetical protein